MSIEGCLEPHSTQLCCAIFALRQMEAMHWGRMLFSETLPVEPAGAQKGDCLADRHRHLQAGNLSRTCFDPREKTWSVPDLLVRRGRIRPLRKDLRWKR